MLICAPDNTNKLVKLCISMFKPIVRVCAFLGLAALLTACIETELVYWGSTDPKNDQSQPEGSYVLVGEHDSYIALTKPEYAGLSLTIADNLDCQPLVMANCTNLETFPLNQKAIESARITSSTPVFLWLQDKGAISDSMNTALTELPIIRQAQVVEFKGYLWSFGGELREGRKTEQAIWRSADGYHWSKVVEVADYGLKEDHHVVVFNDKLWLTGGQGSSNEVWVSDNGVDWTKVTQVMPYPGRSLHQVVVFQNKMWMLGGQGAGNTPLNDVLTSTDGANWTVETTPAPFTGRYDHQAIAFKNKLWVFNGQSQTGTAKRDKTIYSSDDGLTWTLETDSPTYGGIRGQQILEFEGKLWLVSGYTNGYRQQVYSSDDAVNWVLENSKAFDEVAYHQVVEFKRRLFLLSGGGSNHHHWVSKNGRDWQTLDHRTTFSKRAAHQVVAFNDTLWMVGGRDHVNDYDAALVPGVWRSEDGLHWTQTVSEVKAPFSAVQKHQMLIFNDALWVIGGDDLNTPTNAVWRSENGFDWTEVSQITPFTARSGHQALVFNNRLWVVAGEAESGLANDVWSSADGVNWQLETASADFESRADHAVIAFNNALYLVAGLGDNAGSPVFFNDIYHSVNGVDWTLLTTDAELARYGHTLNVIDGELFVSGGYVSGNASADTLTSADGVSWLKQADAFHHFGVSEHQLVKFNDSFLVLGGVTGVEGYDREDNETLISSDAVDWYRLKHLAFAPLDGVLPAKLLTAVIKDVADLLKTGHEVQLDGSLSDSTDWESLAFSWQVTKQPGGSLASIDNPSAISTRFTPDLDGEYVIELTVNDGSNSATDQITFNTLTEPKAVIVGCESPVIEGDTVTLDGSTSVDAYGQPLTYFWQVGAPRFADNSLANPTAQTVTKVLTDEGNYNFTLTVDNGTFSNTASKRCTADFAGPI